MEWAQVLVIILSVFLAIFLLLGIILTLLLIKVTHQIKRIASSAEHTVRSIEGAAGNISKLTSSSFLFKTVMNFIKNRKQ